jgi:hypothetical protein
MESKERILAALNLEEPDRVPTHALAIYHADEILGIQSRDSFAIIDNLIEANPDNYLGVLNKIIDGYEKSVFSKMCQAAIEIGLDTMQVGVLPYQFTSKDEMSDIFGRIWKLQDSGGGHIDPYFMHGTIDSVEKWKEVKQKFEDTYIKQYPRKAKKLYRSVNMKFKDKIFVIVETVFAGIFESAWEGMENRFFFKHLIKNPKLIAEVYDTYADFNVAMFNAYMDAGAEVFCEAGDLAYKTGPFFSPKKYVELLQPAYKKLTDAVHDRGCKVFLHTDGQITPLLDMIVDSGFDGLHSLEPTANVDLALVKKKVGDKLCLLGNIDVGEVLTTGTKQDVFDAVKYAIKTAGPGGGFMISPTNMHQAVMPQQLRWMVEATHEYGKYPLNL